MWVVDAIFLGAQESFYPPMGYTTFFLSLVGIIAGFETVGTREPHRVEKMIVFKQ